MAAIRSLLAIAAFAIAPACATETTTTVIGDDPVGDTLDEGFANGEALADHAAGELTGDDYLVVIGKTATILATLNDGEIDQAAFAVQIAVDDDIFEFANQLIIDHEDANFELDEVVRFYGVGYLPSTAADALAADMNAGLSILRGTPPADFDFTFVELQVLNHAQATVLLDELAFQVGPGAMGDYIARLQDLINLHLDESEALLATYY